MHQREGDAVDPLPRLPSLPNDRRSLVAGCRVLAKRAQDYHVSYQRKFGDEAVLPLSALVVELALVMQEYTQMAGVRPFGVGMLLAGCEVPSACATAEGGAPEDDVDPSVPVIYKVEASGRFSAWKAAAIGKGSTSAERVLRSRYREVMNRDGALELALCAVVSCTPGIQPGDVDLTLVEAGSIRSLTASDLKN